MDRKIDAKVELSKLTLFAYLPAEDLERVAATATLLRFKKGEYLYREGERPDVVNVLTRGRVKTLTHTSEGKDVIFDVIDPPCVLADAAVHEQHPYYDNAVGLEPGLVFKIPRGAFMYMLDAHPKALREFTAAISRRCTECGIRDSRENCVGPVDFRMARLLLRFAETGGVAEADGLALHIPLTRQDIADIVGTTVETAIRVMSLWRREGIVDAERGRIVITDEAALRRVAGLAT